MGAGRPVRSCLSQWVKSGIRPSPLKGQYAPKPTYLLWPHLAAYLPFVPKPISTLLHCAQGWPGWTQQGALCPPASAGFGQWRAPQERVGQEPVGLGYLFFSRPKGHPTTRGHNCSQVALSSKLCPSKFHNCSLPAPVRT